MTDLSLPAAGGASRTRARLDGITRRTTRPWQALAGVPGLGTWVGLGLVVLGMVLVAVAWAVTATEEAVTGQLPVLLSVGGSGLALTVVGVTVVNLASKQADSRDRRAQLEQLRVLLERLADAEEQR